MQNTAPLVQCPNAFCEQIIENGNLPKHLEECLFKIVKCESCSAAIMKLEEQSHNKECLGKKVSIETTTRIEPLYEGCKKEKCKYCDLLVEPENLQTHIKENAETHLDSLLTRINNLEKSLETVNQKISTENSDVKTCKKRFKSCLRQKIRQGFEIGVSSVRGVVDAVSNRIENSSPSQRKDWISRIFFGVIVLFALNMILPWFIKLPFFCIAARNTYRRLSSIAPTNKVTLGIYLLFCWWVYAVLLC